MKQVIVMRTDLNMRKGKMCSQAAHASVGIVMRYLEYPPYHKYFRTWEKEGTTKICVGANSEKIITRLAEQAYDKELPFYIVTDAGRTEFNGVPTVTCIAIGPAPDEEIDKLTGELKLI